MNIDELIEIAIANAGEERVSVNSLDPATITTEAVSGLAQLLAELVDNAVAFSEPGETVILAGEFSADDYVISVADLGVGMSPHLLAALNRVLEDPRVHVGGPEPRLGIQLVARLASRHGIGVELVPTRPGTTARVTVPARLVDKPGRPDRESVFAETSPTTPEVAHGGAPRPVSTSGLGRTIDLTKYETRSRSEPDTIVSDSDVERFLESVFSPLKEHSGERSGQPRPATSAPSGSDRQQTTLRVRVPGENFSLADDEPSTMAGEGAVDIRRALSSFSDGRRTATRSETDD